jgi:DNA polymerase-1
MHLIIDGDIVAYRAAASAEDKSEAIARSRTDETMEQIYAALHGASHSAYISGDNNFRYRIYPEYKANRKDQVRPRWLEDCKEHLVVKWGAEVTDGFEADDAMAIEATETPGSTICSIDKDLRQIPGRHFNWVKQEITDVSESEGIYNFYWHVLVGDSADNIKGCPKIGPVKATKMLSSWEAPQEWFEIVRNAYNDDSLFLLNGQLIWLWRKENDIWRFPGELLCENNEGCSD